MNTILSEVKTFECYNFQDNRLKVKDVENLFGHLTTASVAFDSGTRTESSRHSESLSTEDRSRNLASSLKRLSIPLAKRKTSANTVKTQGSAAKRSRKSEDTEVNAPLRMSGKCTLKCKGKSSKFYT